MGHKSKPHTKRRVWDDRRTIESLESRELLAANLIADLNTTPLDIEVWSMQAVGNDVLFLNSDGVWKTDGQPGGTTQVAKSDIASPASIALGENILFIASTPENGRELWITDGTADGTQLLKDTLPGPDSGWEIGQGAFLKAGNHVYFWAPTESQTDPNAVSLWRTDGTTNGTVPLGNSESFSFARRFVSSGNSVYAGSLSQSGLWQFTGDSPSGTQVSTQLATVVVAATESTVFYTALGDTSISLWSYNDGTFTELTTGNVSSSGVVNGKLYFVPAGRQELWVSDGTSEGTGKLDDVQHLKSIAGSVADSVLLGIDRPIGWVPFGPSESVFESSAQFPISAPAFDELWSYDISDAASTKLDDWQSTSDQPGFWPKGDDTFFAKGPDLWKTNGTATGTTLVAENLLPTNATLLDETLVIAGQGLWTSNGTSESTMKLQVDSGKTESSMPIDSRRAIPQFQALGSRTYFAAGDAVYSTNATDTALFRQWPTGEPTSFGAKEIAFVAMPFHGNLIFEVYRGEGTYTLWASDGTQAGTRLLASDVSQLSRLHQSDDDLYLKTLEGTVIHIDDSLKVSEVVSFENVRTQTGIADIVVAKVDDYLLLKTTNVVCEDGNENCTWGLELRAIEIGNSTAESLVTIESNQNSARQQNVSFAEFNGGVAFIGVDDAHGREIWWTNGQPDGTKLLLELQVGQGSKEITRITAVNDRLVFEVNNLGRVELWTTDGTPAGTRQLRSGLRSTSIYSTSEQLFISAEDITNNPILLATDGINSTQLRPTTDPFVRRPEFLTDLNGIVYFRGVTATHGSELWVTDGTVQNTSLLTDIFPGERSGFPQFSGYRDSQGQLGPQSQKADEFYFVASDPWGDELWRTDGSAEGTKQIADVNEGAAGSFPHSVSVVGNDVYFAANNEFGFEPWIFREEASRLAGDINGDNEVSFTDFLILSSNYGLPADSIEQGDLDGSGSVDFADFLIVAENYGRRQT